MKFLSRAALTAVFGLAGCANLNTVNHRFSYEAEDGTTHSMRAATVDANQRFMVSTMEPNSGAVGDKSTAMWRACTEPSPDGMAVFGGSFAGQLSRNETTASLAAGLAAQAASIGLRTQSITLLRDAQYRLCEAFLNGSLDSGQLFALQRRFQNIMVANLAIEQLTGYARPTITQVGVGGAASVSGGLADAQKSLEDGKKQEAEREADASDAATAADKAAANVTAKKTDLATTKAALPANAAAVRSLATTQAAAAAADRSKADKAKAAIDAAKDAAAIKKAEDAYKAADATAIASEDQAATTKKEADALNKPLDDATAAVTKAQLDKTAADTASKDAEESVADAKANVAALKVAVEAARGLTASGTVAGGSAVMTPPPSPAATKTVVDGVQNIVNSILQHNDADDSCSDYLTVSASNDAQTKSMCMFRLIFKLLVDNGVPPTEAARQAANNSAYVTEKKLDTFRVYARSPAIIDAIKNGKGPDLLKDALKTLNLDK